VSPRDGGRDVSRQPRLPHPPGPVSVTTRLREHRDGAGQVAVATDERADRHDGRAGRGAGAEGPAGSCVPQRLPVQRAQLRRRVQTQLLRQLVAQPVVGAQRIAGSPRSHQPADEYRDRAFAQRLGGHQRFGRDHRLTGAASGEQRLGPLFDGGGPQAGETGDLGLDVGVVELGEKAGHARARVPRRARRACGRSGLLRGPRQMRREPRGIHTVGGDVEAVGARAGADGGRRRQQPAQAGDVGLQRAVRIGRQLVAPHKLGSIATTDRRM
jgi:hypothetical protein